MSARHQQELDSLIRMSPMTWFELRATILDQHRKPLTQPHLRANWLQLEEEKIADWMESHGLPTRMIKLKGRRQGSSTGSLARMAHRVRAKPTSALICGLDYDKNIRAMEDIFWRFVNRDRYDWKVTGTQRKGSGGEFSNDSKLTLQSANTPQAGRGDGAQVALFTEVAHYPNTEERSQDELFKALFQLIPREPGTEIVMESTPKGQAGTGRKFYETWQKANTFADLVAGRIPADWNGFVKIFYPWHEHPNYVLPVTPEEAAEIIRTMSEREEELVSEHPDTMTPGRLKWRRMVIAGADFDGDEESFETEYPSDDVRCFAATGAKVFSWKAVSEMKQKATPGWHGKVEWSNGTRFAAPVLAEERESWIRVWKSPEHGWRHLLVVDPMTGDQAGGKDPDSHGALVLRAGGFDVTGKWCAPCVAARLADCAAEMRAVRKNSVVCRWPIDLLDERIARVARWYGNCMVVIEENMDRGLIELQKQRGNVVLYRRETEDRVTKVVTERYGWKTTPKNRGAMIENFGVAVRHHGVAGHGIDIEDIRIIAEMERFVRKEDGKEEAGTGWHDDTVLAGSIGLAVIGKATLFIDHLAMRQMLEDDGMERRGGDATWS